MTRKTSMRSGRRPSPEGTRLLFAGTITVLRYAQLMDQQKDDTKNYRTDAIQKTRERSCRLHGCHPAT